MGYTNPSEWVMIFLFTPKLENVLENDPSMWWVG